jgi:hypothetical protein
MATGSLSISYIYLCWVRGLISFASSNYSPKAEILRNYTDALMDVDVVHLVGAIPFVTDISVSDWTETPCTFTVIYHDSVDPEQTFEYSAMRLYCV